MPSGGALWALGRPCQIPPGVPYLGALWGAGRPNSHVFGACLRHLGVWNFRGAASFIWKVALRRLPPGGPAPAMDPQGISRRSGELRSRSQQGEGGIRKRRNKPSPSRPWGCAVAPPCAARRRKGSLEEKTTAKVKRNNSRLLFQAGAFFDIDGYPKRRSARIIQSYHGMHPI